MSWIVRAVHQSSSKLGDTPLARLDLFESLPSRRFGCRASVQQTLQQNRALHRSTTEAPCPAADVELYSSTALQSALHLYSSTALYTLHPLHPPSVSHIPNNSREPLVYLQQDVECRPHGDTLFEAAVSPHLYGSDIIVFPLRDEGSVHWFFASPSPPMRQTTRGSVDRTAHSPKYSLSFMSHHAERISLSLLCEA